MRLVFWQNCLSPHQMPYITKLLEDKRVDKVDIITGCVVGSERQKMGWNMICNSDWVKYDIFMEPSEQTVQFLLEARKEDSVHFFSGIRGFDFVFSVLKMSMKYNIKRGIISEQPLTYAYGRQNAKPLWLHKLRYKLQDWRFISSIDYVFAIGGNAVDFFKSLSTNWHVYSFAYCITSKEQMFEHKNSDTLKICYVGSLSPRKNVRLLLKANKQMDSIVGGGSSQYLW